MISISQVHNYTKELKILFVEDDVDLLNKMASLFSNLFAEVQTAQNGLIGLQKFKRKLKETNKPFDLVITDISMPVMNGVEMVKEIREIVPIQPVIVTSAHNESSYLIELLNVGINGFLLKPLDRENINKSLYLVSKAIHNEVLVENYYSKIEFLNEKLLLQRGEIEKANEELRDKNVALEKSMRIIEGFQNQSLNGDDEKDFYEEISLESEKISEADGSLKRVETIIFNVVTKNELGSLQNSLLKELSLAIFEHSDSLSNETKFDGLRESLKKLSIVSSVLPKSVQKKEGKNAFNAIESFFRVYSKSQKEWTKMDDANFKSFSDSMAREIKNLIQKWEV